MPSVLDRLFGSNGFMPHGMCYLWQPGVLWLNVASDAVVALSYFAIPPVLVYLVIRARRELSEDGALGHRGLPYDWMFLAFGLFIVSCGVTHLFEVLVVWKPVYWLSGSAKAVTAMASAATAVALPPLVPKALRLVRAARDSERTRLELERANGELRSLYARLKEVDRLKSEMFTNVSHELRTPLTLILGPTENLLADDTLTAEQHHQLDAVHRNGLQLLSHVDDLLEAASLEAGAAMARPAEVDLAALVEGVAAQFEVLAAERGIRFDVEVPGATPAHLDRSKSERILLNLLSNAFKHAPVGGCVRVRLHVPGQDRATREAVISVEDDGPGIPEHLRESAFERFRQLEGGSTRRHGGTGLGLSIARQLAELQDGTIHIEKSELGGAAFRVKLPLPEIGVEGPAPDAPDPLRASAFMARARQEVIRSRVSEVSASEGRDRPRILLVDDHADMREYLARVLGDEFDCVVARDGSEGVALAVADPPDAIVTDLMMPGLSGTELIREVRLHRELDETPILVLTARGEADLPARLLGQGAQDFLVKPTRGDELLARLRNLVGSASARRVLRDALDGAEGDLPQLSGELAARKRALERAIQDKEVLLRELHHRVKGNLQTVASLLSLQLRSVRDPAAREALTGSHLRVRAIALVHERLYQEGGLQMVEVAGYFRGLVAQLGQALGGPGRSLDLDVASEPLNLHVEQAVACGLIAHELIANALEHGAGEDGTTRVSVTLASDDDDIRLDVCDRGRGFEEEGTAPGGGLGMELVRALTRQLRGNVTFRNLGGLHCTLTFPAHPRTQEKSA